MRVGYLGPAGTYSEEALRASAPAGVEEVPVPDDLRRRDGRAGRRGRARGGADRERARGRRGDHARHARAARPTDVRIVAEVVHPIHHCVVAARELELADVARVVSHPQATAQCARFLRERLPHAERVLAPSTADAVLSRARRRPSRRWRSARAWPPSCTAAACWRPTWRTTPTTPPASCGSARDGRGRRAGPAPPRPPSCSGAAATSRRAGSWTRCASSSDRDVNLTRIESRPRRMALGHYMFFADLEGGVADARRGERAGGAARAGGGAAVLGSYTSAGGASRLHWPHRGGKRDTGFSRPRRVTRNQALRARCTGPAGPRSAQARPAGCSCSTPATSRSTCARSAARPC